MTLRQHIQLNFVAYCVVDSLKQDQNYKPISIFPSNVNALMSYSLINTIPNMTTIITVLLDKYTTIISHSVLHCYSAVYVVKQCILGRTKTLQLIWLFEEENGT